MASVPPDGPCSVKAQEVNWTPWSAWTIEPLLRRALSDGHVEGVHDELGVLDRIDRPSDDASAAGVHARQQQ